MSGTEFREGTPHQDQHFGRFILAVRKDVAEALANTDGDYIPIIVDSAGRLHIAGEITSAIPAGDNNIGNVDLASEIPAGAQVIGEVKITGGVNSVDTITKDGRTSLYVASGYTDTQTIHIDVQNIQTQTAFMLIDLSDTTNWPHTNTGHINIEYIIIEIDPDDSFAGETKVGFLSNVGGTDGDFNQLLDIDMVRKSDLLVENLNFGTHGLDCELTKHFGPILANSALFQTDVNLEGPDGNTNYPSGDGDLVMLIERSTGAVDVSVTIGYETAE